MTVPCDDHPDVHTSDCWLQHEIILLLCETKRSHNCCISAVRKPDLFVVLCFPLCSHPVTHPAGYTIRHTQHTLTSLC